MALPRTLNLIFARISGLRFLGIGEGGAVKDDVSPMLKVICGRTRVGRSFLSRTGTVGEGIPSLFKTGGEAEAVTIRRWVLSVTLFVILILSTTT